MRVRHLLCAFLMTAVICGTAYGDDSTPQNVTMFGEEVTDSSVELRGSKVITEDFSFKMPDKWKGSCVMVPGEDSLEIYDKAAYEEDGSGLLFVISVYEDSSYKDLSDYTLLGLCGNKTYVLEEYYSSELEDEESQEYKDCEEAVKTLKRSFVSFIKEEED